MKLSEDELFRETGKLLLERYDCWEREADIPAPTERAMIGGTNLGQTTCLLIFKGCPDDLTAIRAFLHKRKMKKI